MHYVALQFLLIAALLWTCDPVGLPPASGIMVALAAGLACWALLSIRARNLRIGPTPKPGAPLVQHGPYAWMRHPMYTAVLFAMAATLAAPPDGIRLVLWLLLLGTLFAKARREEALLAGQHDSYAAYAQSTNRFLPVPRRWVPVVRRGTTLAVRAAAAVLLLQIICAVLPFTRNLNEWLAARDQVPESTPAYVVVLGGGGMPSGSTLLRSYHGAQFAARWPESIVVLCMPVDGALEGSDASRMRDELILRGVPANRIWLEREGRNTAEQAACTLALLDGDAADQQIAIVTSGGHMRRALLCFRKVGFKKVGSATAEDQSVEADLGNKLFARYGFWTRLQGQSGMLRELVALAVYRLRNQV